MFEPKKPTSEQHPQFAEAEVFVQGLIIAGDLDQPVRLMELETMAQAQNISDRAIDQFVTRAITARMGLLHKRIGKGVEVSEPIRQARGLIAWMTGYTPDV